MIESKTHVKNIVTEFSQALKSKKKSTITEFLSDTGTFQIQNDNFETVDVDKGTFLAWIFEKFQNCEILKIEYDHCLYCKIGSPVLLINDGQFPRIKKDDSERSMTGLMLEIINEKIEEVRFCYTFRQTENKYAIEIKAEKIKQLMANGLTFEEAYKIACKK